MDSNRPEPGSREAEAAARVLALLLAPEGRLDLREVSVLREVDAFGRIGISPERFAEIAREGVRNFGGFREHAWIPADEEAHLDELLDAVADPRRRRLVCALAAAARRAGGRASREEHLLYDHALARWHVDRAQLERMVAAVP